AFSPSGPPVLSPPGKVPTLHQAPAGAAPKRVLKNPSNRDRRERAMLQESAVGAVEAPAGHATQTQFPLWNDTEREYLAERCVPELVSAQAAANPLALAVAHGSNSLSYGELEVKANRLARHLRSLGLGPETPVGLCLGHSIDFVVGALAILKAGGAYLPLDPAYPLERLLLMLKDSGAGFLVTDSSQLPCLANGPWKVISLDGDAQVIARSSTTAPAVIIKPRDLAYLIYTSGSTGLPKAVEITHGGLLNLVLWHQRAFGVTADDRAPFAAAVSFDAAVWEIWPYLAAGASLHLLADRSIYTAPESLRDWLVKNKI